MICRIPIVIAVLSLAACGGSPPGGEESASTRVENVELRLALSSVPEPFVLAENSGRTLRFTTTHESGGELIVEAGEPEYGLNLLAQTTRQGDAFRAMEGGEYNGSRELGTPSGPAYYSRGSYAVDGGREEQTLIFGLHPVGDSSLLTLTYTYPAGEGQERVNELLGVLGEIEGLFGAQDPAADEPDPEPDAEEVSES